MHHCFTSAPINLIDRYSPMDGTLGHSRVTPCIKFTGAEVDIQVVE